MRRYLLLNCLVVTLHVNSEGNLIELSFDAVFRALKWGKIKSCPFSTTTGCLASHKEKSFQEHELVCREVEHWDETRAPPSTAQVTHSTEEMSSAVWAAEQILWCCYLTSSDRSEVRMEKDRSWKTPKGVFTCVWALAGLQSQLIYWLQIVIAFQKVITEWKSNLRLWRKLSFWSEHFTGRIFFYHE